MLPAWAAVLAALVMLLAGAPPAMWLVGAFERSRSGISARKSAGVLTVMVSGALAGRWMAPVAWAMAGMSAGVPEVPGSGPNGAAGRKPAVVDARAGCTRGAGRGGWNGCAGAGWTPGAPAACLAVTGAVLGVTGRPAAVAMAAPVSAAASAAAAALAGMAAGKAAPGMMTGCLSLLPAVRDAAVIPAGTGVRAGGMLAPGASVAAGAVSPAGSLLSSGVGLCSGAGRYSGTHRPSIWRTSASPTEPFDSSQRRTEMSQLVPGGSMGRETRSLGCGVGSVFSLSASSSSKSFSPGRRPVKAMGISASV